MSKVSLHAFFISTVVGSLAAFSFTSAALAVTPAEKQALEAKLKAFHANPKAAMEQLPPKTTKGTRLNKPTFSADQIRSLSFVLSKNDAREAICNSKGTCVKDVLSGRAAAPTDASEFFDLGEFPRGKKPVYKIQELDQYRQAALAESPWSDTYWPIYQGVLGARYASRGFNNGGEDWKRYYDFTRTGQSSLREIATTQSPLYLETLSPSEKYDLLIGTLSDGREVYDHGYLTPVMWKEGERYYQAHNGKVEPWMGICHGWAAAAYMLPRPRKVVSAKAADGQSTINFYPSDIKGLGSYLWAKVQPETRFIGGRCNDKGGKKDPATGRLLDEACFDTNPANWHTIVINQIGIAKRSFVLDATFDYEVWNQPVHSFSYIYFNPQTMQGTDNLKDGTVDIRSFKNDKFKKFRSPKAVAVVGVQMQVAYVVETQPSHSATDDARRDALQSATYVYDLEIDASGKVIGGEWYSNVHPDFLWSPYLQANVTTPLDSQVANAQWDFSQPLPPFWADMAVRTAKAGLPMATIVNGLFAESNK